VAASLRTWGESEGPIAARRPAGVMCRRLDELWTRGTNAGYRRGRPGVAVSATGAWGILSLACRSKLDARGSKPWLAALSAVLARADYTFARDQRGRAAPHERRKTGRPQSGICRTKGRAKPYETIASGGAARGCRSFCEGRPRHRLSDKGRGVRQKATTASARVLAYWFRIAARASAGTGKAVSFRLGASRGLGGCPRSCLRGRAPPAE